MYQHLYSRFLAANPDKLHFACHSHYFWPDVTRDAQLQYWDDSARFVDDKWSFFFQDCVPALQSAIAATLNIPSPEQIVFAPNTHELLYRIYSCFDPAKRIKVLTTDSEFHSFSRQISRLEESGQVDVTRISSQPYATFNQRFIEAIESQHYDWVFFSHVFFNSGVAVDNIEQIVDAVPSDETLVVVDGYHGFMALPTNLERISQRAFYLAGGYKYAQGGEGGCFAVVPVNCLLRPVYTGWYAEFGELSQAKEGHVNYSKNGMRFAGATMDFSALYRMRAVFELFDKEQLDVASIDQYVKQCQRQFLSIIDGLCHPLLNRDNLLSNDLSKHGHFLTFALPSEDDAASLHQFLAEHGVLTDFRANRLRFGFALYHDPAQYRFDFLSNGGVR